MSDDHRVPPYPTRISVHDMGRAGVGVVEELLKEAKSDLATRTQERDEARAAFVECFDLLTGMRSAVVRRRYVYLRETYRTLDDGHAALYAACTKGGEPVPTIATGREATGDPGTPSTLGPPRGGW